MKSIKIKRLIIFVISSLIYTSISFSQVVISEKAAIHIDNIKSNLPELELMQPEIITGRTAVFEESLIKVFGKLKNGTSKLKILVNNTPATITADNFFYTDLTLKPGLNKLQLAVLNDTKIEASYEYELYYKIGQKNLTSPSLAYGKYHALIIGINNYTNPSMTDLKKPIEDATNIYNVLVNQYQFEKENAIMLPNPTRKQIYEALDKLKAKIIADDNLLIFYAGHGTYDQDGKVGFWLPSDASEESRAEWFSNSSLADYLKLINTRHTLVISDACFAGSIFTSRGAFEGASKAIEKAYELKSRKAITSGSLYEVPDNSVFIYYLLDRLRNNTEPYLTSEQLFINIRTAVKNNGADEAKYGEIQGVGDEGGDFVFVLRQKK